MEHLISMTAFVLEQCNNENIGKKMTRFGSRMFDYIWSVIFGYAKFLNLKLEIWMFIPCKLVDGVWVVLEEPRMKFYDSMTGWNCPEDARDYEDSLQEFQQAKELCLFEGFELGEFKTTVEHKSIGSIYVMFKSNNLWFKNTNANTIEDLVKYKPKLTPTALKQIGL